jgi:hypothetical protein
MDRVAPAFEAVCKYEPRPGSRRSRFPRTNISHTISENQPPATDIIEFQISPMAVCGRLDLQAARSSVALPAHWPFLGTVACWRRSQHTSNIIYRMLVGSAFSKKTDPRHTPYDGSLTLLT